MTFWQKDTFCILNVGVINDICKHPSHMFSESVQSKKNESLKVLQNIDVNKDGRSTSSHCANINTKYLRVIGGGAAVSSKVISRC